MTIEIHSPEVEAIIRNRMAAGGFRNAEDVIVQALMSTPPAEGSANAAQACWPEKPGTTVCGFPVQGPRYRF